MSETNMSDTQPPSNDGDCSMAVLSGGPEMIRAVNETIDSLNRTSAILMSGRYCAGKEVIELGIQVARLGRVVESIASVVVTVH
jgi:hypothetical protein